MSLKEMSSWKKYYEKVDDSGRLTMFISKLSDREDLVILMTTSESIDTVVVDLKELKKFINFLEE